MDICLVLTWIIFPMKASEYIIVRHQLKYSLVKYFTIILLQFDDSVVRKLLANKIRKEYNFPKDRVTYAIICIWIDMYMMVLQLLLCLIAFFQMCICLVQHLFRTRELDVMSCRLLLREAVRIPPFVLPDHTWHHWAPAHLSACCCSVHPPLAWSY